MGITWKLETPMPAVLFERFAALLAAYFFGAGLPASLQL